MRNIVDYPIRRDEIISALDYAQKRAVEYAPFAVHATVLYRVQQWLIDHPDAVDDIVESLKV